MKSSKKTFLNNAIDMAALCSHALERDNFSECFRPVRRLKMYNSGVLYIFSFIARYFILFPTRLTILLVGGMVSMVYFFYGVYTLNEATVSYSFTLFFRMFVFVFNCHIKHYGNKHRLEVPHVYVSNHTSFIDFMILSSYRFCHACISESHGGLFGFVFNTILSRNGSIAFKRSEKQDREAVLGKIKTHIQKNKSPMLIFPEGTCVNNDYLVLFQKGAFELDAMVCPVGIRYKKKLMDPYWNRRVHCFTVHLLYLMTRWRIDAEVHWLEPVKRLSGEDSVEFSHRVKNLIAQKIGLKNTLWNGYFKSSPVIKDRMLFKTAYQNTYNKQRKGTLSLCRGLDIEKGRFYLMDENIYFSKDDARLYFESVTYDVFINECCKEYLRLKNKKESTINATMDLMTDPNLESLLKIS